jgi:hypothetical protein
MAVRSWTLCLLASLWSGCSTPEGPVPEPDLAPDRLAFLVDGRTPKKDVLARLETPSGSFDNGKLLAYTLTINPQMGVQTTLPGQARIEGFIVWTSSPFCLVLAFDAEDVLESHVLLRMRPRERKEGGP